MRIILLISLLGICGVALAGGNVEKKCFDKANKKLTRRAAEPLCSNATSLMPLNCFLAIPDGELTLRGSLDLCLNATSLNPVNCFKSRRKKNMSVEKAVESCAQKSTEEVCFDKANKKLTRRAAEPLCSNATSLMPLNCFLAIPDGELTLRGSLDLCLNATSLNPVNCFKSRRKKNMSVEKAVESCAQQGFNKESTPYSPDSETAEGSARSVR